ncbi:MAG: LacI family DNA-binding transcriptional regulator, partial [Armatimonadetes bacterium]|nr:LacI family DNA-binding transcriptional regulator [Candidatus Hippobium faecium]
MRITRNHVAREAGVSATTVSFILNGKTEAYNPKTVKIVLETAKRLGYAPNNIAKALKTGRSNIITVWVYDITDNKNAELIQIFFKILYKRNISILLKDTKFMTEFKEEMSSDGIICINSEEYKKKYDSVAFYS